MLSSIFIALFQAAAGDPAAVTETPAAEAPAAATEAAPRTERRRVCRTYEAGTGGRLPQRRCRWEERPIRDAAAPEADAADMAATQNETAASETTDDQTGGAPAAASPSPPSPQ